MPDHEMDTNFRRLFDSLNLSPEPGDWNSFETLLENNPSEMDDRQLDHPLDMALRNSLAGLDLTESATDWDLFEARLDAHPVDTFVKEAVASLVLPLSGADWFSMESQLDAPFYGMLRQRLDGYEAAYMARDWRKMQAILGASGRTVAIPRWRSTAIAVAASLMLMAGIFFYQRSYFPRVPHTYAAIQAPNRQPDTPGINAASTTHPDAPLIKEYQEKTPVDPAIPAHAQNDYLPAVAVSASAAAAQPALYPDSPSFTHEIGLTTASYGSNQLSRLALASQNSFSLEPIAIDAPQLDVKRDRKRPNIRVALMGGSARSSVELNDETRPGWIAGIRIEAPINQTLSIITGLFSAEKHFQTTAYVFENNNSLNKDDFSNLASFDVDGYFQTLEAPVMVRCYLPGEDKLKIYTQAGVVAMLALKESYEKTPVSDLPTNVLSRQPVIHDRRYTTYVGNVQGALGLEYQINNTLSLQVEPYFQLGLQRTQGSGSLGTTKKLYTSGVIGGVSVQL